MIPLRDQPYWTDADQAELEVLVHELVRVSFAHRERCSECPPAGRSCAALTDAIDAVIEWRDSRILRSKAAWLRAREAAREWLVEAQHAA